VVGARLIVGAGADALTGLSLIENRGDETRRHLGFASVPGFGSDSGWRPWLRYGLLLTLGALLSALAVRWGVNPHDEGLMLAAGRRVSDGQLPYRDFYANYGPGQYLLVGGLDALLGPSLMAWRVVRVLLDAGVAVLAYALARRDASEPLALAAWLAVAAAMAYPIIPHPNPAALALGFASLLAARSGPGRAGALAGLAFLFRFDIGIAAATGAALAAAEARGKRTAGRVIAVAAVVGALALAPFVLAAPGEFWDQTFGFALDEQGLQRLPLPGAWQGGFEPNMILQHYFAYVLLAGAALWLVLALRSRAPLRMWAPAPLALAGVVYLLARADEFHLVPLAAVLPVLLATVADRERRAGRWPSVAAAVLLLALIAVQALDRKRIQLLDPPPQEEVAVDVADGVEAPEAEARALSRLVRYVRSRVPAAAPIFVANPRHDLVKVGNPLVYVLADRPNPTRYDVFQPGVITSAPVQREVLSDLRRTRPELVVRWDSPVADDPEPNGAGRPSGVHLLDRYLGREYDPVAHFGDYTVLARRDVRAPQA
jgi:hypothetical protein